MAQPVYITPAGSLGTVPEGKFFQVPILAYDPDNPDNPNVVYYIMIAGSLPEGVQCRKTGLIEGIPKAVVNLQGVPSEVSRNVTSKFTVRSFTEKTVDGVEVVDRVADRTFTLTVTGADDPEFVTPAGNVGTYYDGTQVDIQIQTTDADPGDVVTVSLVGGSLPPGLTLTNTGLISGVIAPLTGVPGTVSAGYDETAYDIYTFDFSNRSASRNYQFTLGLSDGKSSNLRTFEIYVYSKDSMTGDTTDFTGDDSYLTGDVSAGRKPVLINTPGSLGTYRHDNYFAYKFTGIDYDGEPVSYELVTGLDTDSTILTVPPGLALDSSTGWLYGYLPDLGAVENTYRFAVRVSEIGEDSTTDLVSDNYYFTIKVVGGIENAVTWISSPDLGTIQLGEISTFAIEATNPDGRPLNFRLESGGVYQKLPQGLKLLSDGTIAGQCSFIAFTLDQGTTTFDKDLRTRLTANETTIDRTCSFTVEAYNDDVANLVYKVKSITVANGGSAYTSTPTVTISAPDESGDSIQAVAGTVAISGGEIQSIAVEEEGYGYLTAPTITITGGGGSSASAVAVIEAVGKIGSISVTKTFTIMIQKGYHDPFVGLYIKALPTLADRETINQLIGNQDVIPADLIYRPEDSNFGKATSVKYAHAFGLTAASLERYVASLDLNHYFKNLTLGEIKTARAVDINGDVIYEVVYSSIVDDLVNNAGISIAKEVTLPYPVTPYGDSVEISTVYPNSLINMRDQVISEIGQIDPGLPGWMTSKQENGSVLGFTPAWVICYTKPGASKQIQYSIQKRFSGSLNAIDFIVDRLILEGKMTRYWTPFDDSTDAGSWATSGTTTFNTATTTFDDNSLKFIRPSDTYVTGDEFDKYLVFSKTTILG